MPAQVGFITIACISLSGLTCSNQNSFIIIRSESKSDIRHLNSVNSCKNLT